MRGPFAVTVTLRLLIKLSFHILRFDLYIWSKARRTAALFPCRWLWNAPFLCAQISRREPASGLLHIQHGAPPCTAQCLCACCRRKHSLLSMDRRSDGSDTCPCSFGCESWQSRRSRSHKRQWQSACPNSG